LDEISHALEFGGGWSHPRGKKFHDFFTQLFWPSW